MRKDWIDCMRTSHKEQPTIKVLGRLDINGHDILKRIYSIDGYCPTLTTMMGGANTTESSYSEET